MNKRKKALLLIPAAILTAAAAVYMICALNAGSDKHTAEISVDGKIVRTIDLRSAADETFTVGTEDAYNIITVKDGKIYVSEASCPDKICINHGPLRSELLPIICLPNRLSVKLI